MIQRTLIAVLAVLRLKIGSISVGAPKSANARAIGMSLRCVCRFVSLISVITCSVVIDIDRILQESELRNEADAQRAERRRLAELRKEGRLITDGSRKAGEGSGSNSKRPRMRLVPEVVIPRPPRPVYSCVFCPHPSTVGLLPIYEPSERIRNMVKDPSARAMAHVACARCIPELSIATVEEEYGLEPIKRKRVVVMGSEQVAKERWSLVSRWQSSSICSLISAHCLSLALEMWPLWRSE